MTTAIRREHTADVQYYGLTPEQQARWLIRLSGYHLARSQVMSARARRQYRAARVLLYVGIASCVATVVQIVWRAA